MKKTIEVQVDLAPGEEIDHYVLVARTLKTDGSQSIMVESEGELEGLTQIGLLYVGANLLTTGGMIDG